MWKDYSSGYIKNNRASGVSVMAASFIAALFLAWLCGLFYHFWLDNIEAAKQEFGGGWQGRIVGDFSAEDLLTVTYLSLCIAKLAPECDHMAALHLPSLLPHH